MHDDAEIGGAPPGGTSTSVRPAAIGTGGSRAVVTESPRIVRESHIDDTWCGHGINDTGNGPRGVEDFGPFSADRCPVGNRQGCGTRKKVEDPPPGPIHPGRGL
jgi:hypothetical protein